VGHRHISQYVKFQGIRRLSVKSFQSHPLRGKQHAYLVANVFSGNVATQLRWGGKLCILQKPGI